MFVAGAFMKRGNFARFYEAREFRALKFTDGAHNEEKTPDVRYRWERDRESATH